ncbi:hypothetical protein [Leptothrix cholodnii]|nr:hypothetical protein [Leptothrix cholodnii]
MTQAAFGALVGISQPAVSGLVQAGVIEAGDPWKMWLLAYCARLREQAAGRLSADGQGLDLVQERAALARSQREAQEMRNAVARGEYAPIGLLADVLGAASAAVVDRFDQLDGSLRKTCPDLPEAARTAVQQVIASARNEWIRSTVALVEAQLDALDDEVPEEVGHEDDATAR